MNGNMTNAGNLRGKLAIPNTISGKSAYEIAVMMGFDGTEEEWLASLNGADGADGKDGAPGKDGADGAKGDKGDTGEKGDKGDPGDKGEKGDKGDKGDQGERGLQGEKGDKGDKGDQGIQGIQGVQGVQGIQGEPGIKGEKGDKGDPGTTEILEVPSLSELPEDAADGTQAVIPQGTLPSGGGGEPDNDEVIDLSDVFDFATSIAAGGELCTVNYDCTEILERMKKGSVRVKARLGQYTSTSTVLPQILDDNIDGYVQFITFSYAEGALLYMHTMIDRTVIVFACKQVTTAPFIPVG